MYADQPPNDLKLVWLPCNTGGLQQRACGQSKSASQDDGATPQRRKGHSLHGLTRAAEKGLQEAQQQFWCQQLRLYDQIQELKPLYAKLWLEEIQQKEAEVARRVHLAQEEEEEECEEDRTEEEPEEEEETDEKVQKEQEKDSLEDNVTKEVEDLKLVPEEKVTGPSTKLPGEDSTELDLKPLTPPAEPMKPQRRESDASSTRSSQVPGAAPAEPSAAPTGRAFNLFFAAPLQSKSGALVLPNFCPGDAFAGGTDALGLANERRGSKARCPDLNMLKQLVERLELSQSGPPSGSSVAEGTLREISPSPMQVQVPRE